MMIQSIQFLHNLHDPHFFDKHSVLYFLSDKPQSLFIAYLKDVMRKNRYSLVNINVAEEHEANLYARFSMSFLGNRTFFWLDCFDDLELQRKKKLQEYLSVYTGPHVILIFSTESVKKFNFLTVEIPSLVKKDDFNKLFNVLYEKKPAPMLIEKIFEQYPQLPIDSACLVMEYCLLIGRHSDSFFKQWLPLLIESNHSLFTLSTYFFSKNKVKFFNVWSALSATYGQPFWIMFWSEQLFQAYNFILYAQQNRFVEAKKLSNRLPFTFLQKEWKNYSLSSLQEAHNFLYSLDWSFKNGIDSYFELFFIKFFLGEFEKQAAF